MMKRVAFSRSGMMRYLALAAMTTTLAACGGGSGDDDTDTDFPNLNPGNNGVTIVDNDNDGIADDVDPDADGDGLADANSADLFIDLDGDGLDDFTLDNLGEAYPDESSLASVTENDVCGSVSGTDAFSNNDAWDDNCTIARSINANGIFADSLYAVGIQRILFCAEFDDAATTDYRIFADGEYGPASEAALEAFQLSESLTDDGVVGSQTWGALQDVLLIGNLVQVDRDTSLGVPRDVYSFVGGPCANIAMFYQDIDVDAAGDESFGNWRLAKNTPNEAEAVTFSIEPPFLGRID